MGNSDSKLAQFREHVFQLAGPHTIPLYSSGATPESIARYCQGPRNNSAEPDSVVVPEQDPFSDYFNTLVRSGFDASDVYAVVSTQEVRFIHESHEDNFNNLVRFAALKICALTSALQNCSDVADFRNRKEEIMGCIRILTKVMPVFLERDTEEEEEDALFWNRNVNEVFNYDAATSIEPVLQAPFEALPSPEALPLPEALPASIIDELSNVKVSIDAPAKRSSDPLNVAIEEHLGADDLTPLGMTLLKACLKLLFMEGLTVPVSAPSPNRLGKVSFLLWENGVNTTNSTYQQPNPKLDCNRLEILRLMLTLSSRELYGQEVSKFLVVLCTLMPGFHSICLVSSLVNLVCRSCRDKDDDNGLTYPPNSYNNSIPKSQICSLRKSLVNTSTHLLNLMLLFKISPSTQPLLYDFLYKLNVCPVSYQINNIVTSYLSTLNREFDMKLMLISLATLFKRPMDRAIDHESNPFNLLNNNGANSKSNQNGTKRPPGSRNSTTAKTTTYSSMSLPKIPRLTLQVVILLWELMKCNKSFENYVADKYANKLLIVCIYYLKYYSDCTEWQVTLLPVISGFATYLSSKKLVLSKMLYYFNANYYTNKIPNFFKLSSGSINQITYRDFAITHLANMAISQVNQNSILKSYLFELLFNLLSLPNNSTDEDLVQLSSEKKGTYLGLSYNACTPLSHLISKMASKDYLSSAIGETESSGSSLASAETTESTGNCNVDSKLYVYSPGLKLDMLALLLRAIVISITSHYKESKNLLFILCRHQRIICHLRDSIQEISSSLAKRESSEEGLDSALKNSNISLDDYFDDSAYEKFVNETSGFYRLNTANSSKLGEKFPSQSLLFFDEHEKDHDIDVVSAVASQTANKNAELFEHLDYEYDPILDSTKLYINLRPKRPLGLTFRRKAKMRKNELLSKSWLGSESLNLLMKIVQTITKAFPQLIHITASDYPKLLRKFDDFEPEFQSSIGAFLPLELKIFSEHFHALTIDWEVNSNSARWYRSVLWADIFNYNSVPFVSVFAKEGERQDVMLQGHHQPTSQPTTPSLERWNSHGSVISRTNSNSSSITNYLIHQEPESASNSVPNSPSVGSGFSTWLNGKYSTNQPPERSSLFRFSWTGFHKTGQEDKISEENDRDSSRGSTSHANLFILDSGLLKPNIWVGTYVELFKVKVDEREGFSLMDMTSNILKKLRFSSTTSVNSSDGILVTSGALTPISSRPWTPRGSLTSNASISTPRAPSSNFKF
ncbi:LAFE_0A02388g1_1 [Lachancea fermentati]|uniref:LAFE_0A02388g1_1 n=1 Tax=Lachancea fermentati TaxID=4955 RepID=A0A1G4M6E9_LACFM|nr:LAFE_0A02388g1_1 [Lachancea fermentati]